MPHTHNRVQGLPPITGRPPLSNINRHRRWPATHIMRPPPPHPKAPPQQTTPTQHTPSSCLEDRPVRGASTGPFPIPQGSARGMYYKCLGIRLFKSWTLVRLRGSEG